MINIARQIYSGWDTKVKKYDLPEAEVIPYGISVNEKKKLEKFTVAHPHIQEYDNIPLPGFTLYKSDRKNWGSQDQSWLIIDPRGFLVRITNNNLEEILYVTGITEGLIQEKCVWARDDSQTKMQLIPITSSIYLDAVKNTELIENKINDKDVNIGDKVILQNGLIGTYMGTHSLYAPISAYSYRNNDIRPQVFLRRQIVEIEPCKFHYQTNIKMLKVLEKTSVPMSRLDACKYMNGCIDKDSATYFTNTTEINQSYYSCRDMIRLVSTSAVPKLTMSFTEITLKEASMIYLEAAKTGDIGKLLLENNNKEKFLIKYPYTIKSASISGSFEILELDLPELDSTEILSPLSSGNQTSVYYSYSSVKKPVKTYELDKFVKFYKIVKHVKNETYV